MSWCGCVCGVTEDLADWVEEQVEAAVDIVVETAEDAIEAVGDFMEEAWERIEEGVEEIGGIVAEVAQAVWEWVTETGSSIWDWIRETAGDVWEWTTGAMEDAWEWTRDAVSDAWDWVENVVTTVTEALVTAIEAVADFIEEQVVPFLADALWLLVHLPDIIVGGILSLGCLFFGEQDEREYDLIEGLYMLDPDALEDRKVVFLPDAERYVIFSDLHLFLAGDPKDYFRNLGNHELYQLLLVTYAQSGYTLIENGDIEDLWLRQVNFGTGLMELGSWALGWPFGDAIRDEYEKHRVRTQAFQIFNDNQDIYQVIRSLFHDKGHYVRLLGNHDDAWASGDFLPGLQFVYPELQVFDYALIGDYADRPLEYGNSPAAIVAHGHQMEVWNTPICRKAAATWTELFSFNTQENWFGDWVGRAVERSSWEPKLNGLGFDNQLGESWNAFDELEFYEMVENDFSYYPYVPRFVLGHTHSARENASIPGWMSRDEWNFKEYINEGTAGRWEQFIWCATVENGEVQLYGWTWGEEGVPVGYHFKGGYADFLRPV